MFYVHFIEIAVTENLNLAIDFVLKQIVLKNLPQNINETFFKITCKLRMS